MKFWLISFFVFLNLVHSQVIHVDKKIGTIKIDEQLPVFVPSIEQEKQLQANPKLLDLWITSSTISLHEINNSTSSSWTRFELAPHREKMVFELAQPLLENAEIYFQDSLGAWHCLQSGNRIPINQKPFKHHHQVFPLEQGVQTFYVHFQAVGAPIPARIWRINAFEDEISGEQLGFGIYMGIMLFVIFSQILMGFALKRAIFWHYSFLVTLYATFSGLYDGYLLYLFPNLDLNFWYRLNPVINQPNGLLYSILFLEVKRFCPRYFKFALIFLVYFVSYIVWQSFLPPMIENDLAQLHALIGILVMAFLGIQTARKGNRLGYYYSAAYLAFFLIAGIEVCYTRTGIPDRLLNLSYVSFAILCEVFMLSLLLSKRVQWEKEKMEDAQYQAELEAESAKRLNAAKSDFVSMISHELRTPLTSIVGFANIIRKKLDEMIYPRIIDPEPKLERSMSQVRDNIEIVIDEGVRLTNLINDVLDIAKMEAGKVDWRQDLLDISEILNRSCTATFAIFDKKQIPLVQEIQDQLPQIRGDRDRLIQVVINLLSNALKFTDQGQVICRCQLFDERIRVSIIDSGIGIDPKDHESVFEKFKQVGEIMSDKPKGTGLGLPICKEIIEHHEGRIWLESNLGYGSIFHFEIPIWKPLISNSKN